jgi:hypothetical protein
MPHEKTKTLLGPPRKKIRLTRRSSGFLPARVAFIFGHSVVSINFSSVSLKSKQTYLDVIYTVGHLVIVTGIKISKNVLVLSQLAEWF